MNDLQQGIILLLRSGLTGEKLLLPKTFELARAYDILAAHQIQAVCYLGAVQCGVDKNEPVMKKLFLDYCAVLRHSEKQLAQTHRLFAAFDEAGID